LKHTQLYLRLVMCMLKCCEPASSEQFAFCYTKVVAVYDLNFLNSPKCKNFI